MFVSRTGMSVYVMDYQDLGYRFKVEPLNILCPESCAPGVNEMHSMGEPEPIAWCILADGGLAGCTYIRNQQIFGWHRHETQGKIRSGAIIPYLEGDQFWVAVERENGTFIEYFETPFDPYSEDATFSVFMDSHLSGVTVNDGEVRGLPHLAGQKAQLMQDGSYLGEVPVETGGVIRDSRIYRNAYVVAGLGYTAEMQPMRLNYALPSRVGHGGQAVNFKRRVVSAVLRVLGSIRGEARAEYSQPIPSIGDPGELGPWEEIIAFPHGAIGGNPPPCRSDTVEIVLSGNSTHDALIRVRQADPFPFFLLSIAFGLEQGVSS
jgi:hypothetical protein